MQTRTYTINGHRHKHKLYTLYSIHTFHYIILTNTTKKHICDAKRSIDSLFCAYTHAHTYDMYSFPLSYTHMQSHAQINTHTHIPKMKKKIK